MKVMGCFQICALVGLVGHAIPCGSICAGPQGAAVALPASPPGPTESCPPPLKVVDDRLAANWADDDSDS